MSETTDRVKAIVETWNMQKMGGIDGRQFTQMDMRDFCELMNNRTKQLVSAFQTQNKEFYEDLFTVATAAQQVCAGQYVDDPRSEEQARFMISEFGVSQDDFYTGLFELAQHALTVIQGRKLFADGVDRTNV